MPVDKPGHMTASLSLRSGPTGHTRTQGLSSRPRTGARHCCLERPAERAHLEPAVWKTPLLGRRAVSSGGSPPWESLGELSTVPGCVPPRTHLWLTVVNGRGGPRAPTGRPRWRGASVGSDAAQKPCGIPGSGRLPSGRGDLQPPCSTRLPGGRAREATGSSGSTWKLPGRVVATFSETGRPPRLSTAGSTGSAALSPQVDAPSGSHPPGPGRASPQTRALHWPCLDPSCRCHVCWGVSLAPGSSSCLNPNPDVSAPQRAPTFTVPWTQATVPSALAAASQQSCCCPAITSSSPPSSAESSPSQC